MRGRSKTYGNGLTLMTRRWDGVVSYRLSRQR